ncbi:MAG: acetate/propionate family kinase [Gammaproteobacteria bacterium]|nr:acetate/propionate family kinase [Gammaproteobacteria bacterium]
MREAILVINSGSSSIKFALYQPATNALKQCMRGLVSNIGAQTVFSAYTDETGRTQTEHDIDAGDHAHALQYLLSWLDSRQTDLKLIAIGHRVVHGGTKYVRAVKMDAAVFSELQALIPLAPLHQPHALHAIEVLMREYPQLPQVACFDTAFHAGMPEHERRFALPQECEAMGIRRYGFHGLSYEYIVSVLPKHLGASANGKVVIAHLGHGVSMCAVQARRSIATTMSFTPLDGLPMGKRSGAIDPAVVLYLLARGMHADEVSELLHQRSGLLGISGVSSDMHTLLSSDRQAAREAVAYFCYRINRELGSLAAALGGLDALVFTGGIGEHAGVVRKQIGAAAAWLGIVIDDNANKENALKISAGSSKLPVLVIPTDEEHVIAEQTLTLIAR